MNAFSIAADARVTAAIQASRNKLHFILQPEKEEREGEFAVKKPESGSKIFRANLEM